MDTHKSWFAAFRAFALVAVVSLAFVLLKTFSAWGVLTGFALLQVGLLISFADHSESQTNDRDLMYRRF